MSHIARMLTAVVFMLGLVCLTMPGPATAARPCEIVMTYTQVTPDEALNLANTYKTLKVTYDPQTQTATVTVPTEDQAGCQGTHYVAGHKPNPPLEPISGGKGRSGSTGSGQTGGSSTHQTTGGGSTSSGHPKPNRPTTQTAPSGSTTVK